jgi:hypothetical protein
VDLGTSAAIVGIVAAVVYVTETACKYTFAFFKKSPATTTLPITLALTDGLLKKS